MRYVLAGFLIILLFPAAAQNVVTSNTPDPNAVTDPPGDPGDPTTGVEKELNTVSIRAYPNPSFDHVQFDYEIVNPGIVQISIFDITGKIVASVNQHHETSGKFNIVCTQQLPAGVYYFTSMLGNEKMPAQRLVRL